MRLPPRPFQGLYKLPSCSVSCFSHVSRHRPRRRVRYDSDPVATSPVLAGRRGEASCFGGGSWARAGRCISAECDESPGSGCWRGDGNLARVFSARDLNRRFDDQMRSRDVNHRWAQNFKTSTFFSPCRDCGSLFEMPGYQESSGPCCLGCAHAAGWNPKIIFNVLSSSLPKQSCG